jgi:hypothetical protein
MKTLLIIAGLVLSGCSQEYVSEEQVKSGQTACAPFGGVAYHKATYRDYFEARCVDNKTINGIIPRK